MPTRYCLVPKSQRVDVDLAIFQSALPPSIVLEEERGAVYATVDSTESEDSDTQPLIDRELDRLFFMTSVRLRAEMCRKTVTATLKGSWSLHGSLPVGVRPQIWSQKLALQMRLWALAEDVEEISLKVLFLYQIIELSPLERAEKMKHGDSGWPDPRTEAKLLRNIVAHADDKPLRQTKAYLEFLGLPLVMSNRVHPQWVEKITKRVDILKKEAWQVLQRAL